MLQCTVCDHTCPEHLRWSLDETLTGSLTKLLEMLQRPARCWNSTVALPLLLITFHHLKLNSSHLNANAGVSRVERQVIQRPCKQLRKEECRRWQFNYREAHNCCSLHGVCLLCLLAEAMTGVELETLISRSGSLSKTCTSSLIFNLAVAQVRFKTMCSSYKMMWI